MDALKGLFQSSSEISKQYKTGMMGMSAGLEWYQDQNVYTRTVGPLGGTPLVNGSGQTGSSLNTKVTATAAARLNAGDRFTIAGIYSVNPQNRISTGSLQQFVVLQNFSADGSGNGYVQISPSIISSGQFQNVTASPRMERPSR